MAREFLGERIPDANLPSRGEVQVVLRHTGRFAHRSIPSSVVDTAAALQAERVLAEVGKCVGPERPHECLDVGRDAMLRLVKIARQLSRIAVDDIHAFQRARSVSNPAVDHLDVVRRVVLGPRGVEDAHQRGGKRDFQAGVGAQVPDEALQLVAVVAGSGILPRGGRSVVPCGAQGG
eukprot:scaffold42594_cov64-Phaeocystis_antarctica.AAC.2